MEILPILQSWFSLLIFKLMFKGVSQCMPTVGVLHFSLFNPFTAYVCACMHACTRTSGVGDGEGKRLR
jgi:hypothetical protein